MEPQERELITTLLTRLQSTRGQAKDPEADAMIRQAMTQLPDAPYYLVQTVLIQDLSLQNAQNRISELEQQVAALPAPQQQPTSFLGGLFGRSQPQAPSAPPSGGPWSRGPQAAPPPPPQYAQPQYGQPQYASQPNYAQAAPQGGGMFGGTGGGNSFLKSAAATAAGVAGGALLFQGISSLFGHSYASGLGGMGGGMPGGLSETVVNNYYGENQGGGDYGGGGDAGHAGGGGGDYGGGGDAGYAGGGGGDYGGGGGDYGGGGGDYGGGGESGWDSGGGDFGGGGDDNYNC